jgi:NitT/TauT family transport system substrate-binding protein
MMRRREILRSSALFTMGALSTAILGSCGTQTSQNNPVGGGSSPSPLRVALIPWLGWGSVQIADVKGFFKEEGIEVEQTVFQTVSEINTALLSGKVDLAWLVALDLLVLAEKKPDLKFIYACDYSGEVDAVVGYGIDTPDDLKGKKFAREDIPYEVVFTGEYLKSVDISEKDVQILSMAVPDAAAAFVAGKVDATAIYEPFIGKALKERPGSKVLYTAKGTNTIVNGLAGSAKVLEDRRSDVVAYLRAINKGIKFSTENAPEANEIVAKWTGITAKEVAEQLSKVKLLDMAQNNSIVFNANDPLNVMKSIDAAAPLLMKASKIAKAPKGETLVDASFVKGL